MKTIVTLTLVAWVAAFARPATAETVSLETAPPVVVKTVPVAGAAEVDPGVTELRVTYSKPMRDGSWSWSTWGEENYPATTGKPNYLADRRTCVLPVKLNPGKFYAIWLNSAKFKNFKDAAGHSAVPYLLTFTTAAKTAGPADPGPLPSVDDLAGKLVFQGRYQHRSRGSNITTPSELWLKKAEGGGLLALASLPWMGTRQLVTGDAANQLTGYRISGDAVGGRPGHRIDLKLRDGSALLTRRGIRQDLTNKELKVPKGAVFDPNTRPDAYCAANILLRAFALKPDETRKFHMIDWDNSGEALVDYTIQVKHAGKERVEVPAGTFEANHLVLTQLTSADTWFKKRANHVTDFWVLDNGVLVRVLRHREPYEMVLLDYAVPDKLDTGPRSAP
ncbi:MAG: DUF3108 domain-containing protein [Akkermansiaceae bacterium]|nr:DUF3108 domain-containing protein [Akkermansiaceae bacterium]